MTFEERLDNYSTTPTARKTRKRQGTDGLTAKQRRRLLHKDAHQWARNTEGEVTR